MSDKPSHTAMPRRTLDSLVALTAGLFTLTGQCYLIVPHLMGGLGSKFPATIAALGGIALFVTGWLLNATVAIAREDWKSHIVHLLGVVMLAGLGYVYFREKLFLQLPLIATLVLFLMAGTIAPKRQASFWDGFLSLFAFVANLSTGIFLFISNRFALPLLQDNNIELNLWMGGLFLAAALIGLVTFWIRNPAWKRNLEKLAALPWLAWIAIYAQANDLSGFLPGASVAGILLLTDYIPWSRLKLPDTDILGRRLLVFIAVIQTAFLVTFYALLSPAESIISEAQRLLVLALVLFTEGLISYAFFSLLITINKYSSGQGTQQESTLPPEMEEVRRSWEERISRLLQPFLSTQEEKDSQLNLLVQQLASTSKQLDSEKRRSSQLILLSELSQQLEAQLDAPVSAQLAVNTLHRSIDCAFAALYLNDPERRELVALAVAGTRASILPPGYRQAINVGVLGRTVRQRKTQVINDSRQDPDFLQIENEDTLSTVAVPLIDHGHMKGVLEISDMRVNAFNSHDIQITEAIAQELLRAWERSEYHHRLTELIQAGITLTTQPDPQAAVQEVANIARQTLRARFVFATLLDQDGNFTRIAHAGHAPRLMKSISQKSNREPLMQAALNADRPFRIRDIRRYKRASRLEIDFSGLRSLIATPIRMHGLSVGAMLAFGKQGEVFFTENDESLARLLSSQASAAIESAWLSHELRTSLAITTQLYQLSFQVIQAEDLKDAATFIANAALKLCDANSAGIILFAPDKQVEAEVQLDEHGNLVPPLHPSEMIEQVIESQQSMILSTGKSHEAICFPLKTRTRTYGAIWLVVPSHQSARFITNLQTLVNQAGVALERSILLVESRQQARAIESAYQELENAYDHTLAALMSSLDARDRETEGHSVRVAQLARLLGDIMQVTAQQRKALERGSLLHDIGKIGISDTILHKPGPLTEAEWKIMRLHPDIGARIVERVPFLQDTLPIIRYHQERWDGSGYPVGLTGKDIPLLARIFAVADAFDALTSDRPYRKRISTEDALQYINSNAGILFDPEIVSALTLLHERDALAGLAQP